MATLTTGLRKGYEKRLAEATKQATVTGNRERVRRLEAQLARLGK